MAKAIKNTDEQEIAVETQQAEQVHPLKKSYMFVSKKHVDYDNLDAFESVALSAVLFLAVLAGTVLTVNIS